MVIMVNSIQMEKPKKAGENQLDIIKEEKVMKELKIKKEEMMMKKEPQRKRRPPWHLNQ